MKWKGLENKKEGEKFKKKRSMWLSFAGDEKKN